MDNNNYYKAYVEVLEILKYVPEESVKKIPKEMLDMFEIKKDKEYKYSIDYSKPFEEQKMLDETSAILANIFRDYWATEHQREVIIQYEKEELNKIEQEKRKIYNPDDIFKSRKIKNIQELDKTVHTNISLPVEIKKEHFYHRLIEFIKKLFKL